MICWPIAIVALNPLSSSLSKVTNDTASAYQPASAASTMVAEMQEAATGSVTKDSLIVVFARTGTLTLADLAVARAARSGAADRDAVKAVRAAVSSAVSSAGPSASAGLTSAVTGDAAVTADSSAGNSRRSCCSRR